MTNQAPLRLHLCLPPGLAAIVQRAVSSGEFVDPEDFVRALVRDHHAALLERARVDRMLAAEGEAPELAHLGLEP